MVTGALSPSSGGLFTSAARLAQALAVNPGTEVHLLGAADPTSPPGLAPGPLRVHPLAARGPSSLGYAPGLPTRMDGLALDVAHSHGLWIYSSVAVLRWHRSNHGPYIVSPHGMLDPWAVRRSAWKKKAVRRLFEDAHLRSSVCIHALCEAEAAAVRAFGLSNPICVIPNGVDLPPGNAGLPSWWDAEDPRRVLLFLGRLHPKKGLAGLLEAWHDLRRSGGGGDWRLVIAGWDEEGHRARLERQVRELGLGPCVQFVGPQIADERCATYAGVDALVLPSHSEGLPMSVLEGWAHGLPVLLTPGCNLPIGVARGAAIEAAPDPLGLRVGLETLMEMTPGERVSMGQRGRDLVAERFEWASVAERMREVYEWAAGGDLPADVELEIA